MYDILLNKLIGKWGTVKIAQVILSSIMGASISGLIAINIIPDKPESVSISEKESKYE